MSKDKVKESPKLPFMDHYRIMWPFVRPYLFRAVLAIALCIPIGALDAVVALALKPYMDVVLVDKSDQSPAYIPLLIVAFPRLTSMPGSAAKSPPMSNVPCSASSCCWSRLFTTSMIPGISSSVFPPMSTPHVPG